jgi:hypothetical protein
LKRTARIAGAALLIALAGCAQVPQPEVDMTTRAGQLQAQIDGYWQSFTARNPGIERPEVDIERVVDLSEADAIINQCIEEEGFPDGEFATGQETQMELAIFVCKARFPLDPKYTRPFTDKQHAFVYDYYLNELVPCLEHEGYEQTVTPPSRQVYIDTGGEGAGWWFPYEAVDADISEDEWLRINELCPQAPLEVYDL